MPPPVPLPPSPPPPRPPPSPLVALLNQKFRDGGQSSDLSKAGVLLRQFDATEDNAKPWRGCPNGNVRDGAGNECAIYGGRFSASIINQQIGAHLFSKTEPGTIYSPSSGLFLRCAYASDGGTRASTDGCKNSDFCSNPMDAWCDGKPHRPEELGNILVPRGGYNEVIIDTQSVEEHLPKAVAAFFYMKGGGLVASSRKKRVEAIREQFLGEYGNAVKSKSFPLVMIDLRNRNEPFSDG